MWDGIVIPKSCIKIVELPITPSLNVRLNSEIFTSLMWINNEHGEQGGENHSKHEPEWSNTLNPDCSVTQRYVYQENAFKKSKNLSPFFFSFLFFSFFFFFFFFFFCCKTIGSSNSFTQFYNNFRCLRFVTVHYCVQEKAPSFDPQKFEIIKNFK